jgi:hypothetical protein
MALTSAPTAESLATLSAHQHESVFRMTAFYFVNFLYKIISGRSFSLSEHATHDE